MGRRPFYAKGPLVNRPTARRPGLFWHDADTDKVYVDDGVEWAEAGGAQVQQSARLLSYNVFVPGTLRPLTIATLASPSLSGAAILRYLEANLQSAPVGVDATNHILARVTGAGGGSADLPLSVAVSRFALDNATPVTQYGRDSQNYSAKKAHVWKFRFRPTVSASISVATVKPFDGSWTGVNRYVVIQDATFNELVRSDVHSFAVTARNWTDHVLQKSVTLQAATDYYFNLVFPGGPGTADLYTGDAGFTNGMVNLDGNAHTGGNAWWGGAGTDETTPTGSLTADSQWGPHFYLKGTPAGTEIKGAITLSLVGVGTVPPDPGADLNLTMRLEV